MTDNSKKVILVSAKELKQITYIQYFVVFQDGVT